MSKTLNSDGLCAKCGSDDHEWEPCWVCHGDGEFDLHDEDAVNYAPGEVYEQCTECRGAGGWVVCNECIRRAKAASPASPRQEQEGGDE